MSNILALRTDADALATVTGDKFDDVYCNTFKTKLDHTREEWERLMEVWTLQQVDECNWNSYPSTFIPGKLDGYCSSDSGRSRSLKPSPTRKRPRSPTPSTLKACRAWNHLSMMQGDWIDQKGIKFNVKNQRVQKQDGELFGIYPDSGIIFWGKRGRYYVEADEDVCNELQWLRSKSGRIAWTWHRPETPRSLTSSPSRKRSRSPTPSALRVSRTSNSLSMMQGDWIDQKGTSFIIKDRGVEKQGGRMFRLYPNDGIIFWGKRGRYYMKAQEDACDEIHWLRSRDGRVEWSWHRPKGLSRRS